MASGGILSKTRRAALSVINRKKAALLFWCFSGNKGAVALVDEFHQLCDRPFYLRNGKSWFCVQLDSLDNKKYN